MPFVQALGATLAGVWFGDNERALVTTIPSLASVFGLIIGFVMPVFFVQDDDKSDPMSAKDKIWWYILTQSAVITLFSLPVFLMIKKEPSTPPSKSAEEIRNKRDPFSSFEKVMAEELSDISTNNFCSQFSQLMKTPNFWILSTVFSFIYGVYNTLGAVVSIFVAQFGYSSSDTSIFGVVFLVSGICGSFIHAILLDKYQKFK